MIPVAGFAPDVDPVTPGVLTDCDGLIPSERGMRAAPTPVSSGLPALASSVKGAAIVRRLNGTTRVFAGTSSALYEAGSTSWTNVSSGTYTLGADARWAFTQFGDSTLAATPAHAIQRILSGATFAAVSGAPQAKLIESVKGFVIVANTTDATYGTSPDRWWCSALYDETSWTPSVSTQATTGRLIEGGGEITALKRLGDDVVAYKRRALFLGRYAGPPVVWDFTQITSDIGCVGQDAVVNTGSSHIFVGDNDIFMYDGVRPQSIALGKVREYFVQHRDPTYAYRTQCLWDRDASLVWIWYPSTSSSGALDSALVYHVLTGRWGRVVRSISAVLPFVASGLTYDGGSSLITTYDSGPAISYDSPFWLSSAEVPAVFGTDSVLRLLSGAAGSSWWVTGDMGDDEGYVWCNGLRVRFATNPTSATATGYLRNDLGASLITGGTSSRDDGAFDLRQAGRWHRFRVDASGDHEFTAMRGTFSAAGRR